MTVRYLRSLVYWLGFRPRPGTILYSPSTDLRLAAEEGIEAYFKELDK